MRIAIADDIKEERDKLADVLTKQLSRRGIHVNLFQNLKMEKIFLLRQRNVLSPSFFWTST